MVSNEKPKEFLPPGVSLSLPPSLSLHVSEEQIDEGKASLAAASVTGLVLAALKIGKSGHIARISQNEELPDMSTIFFLLLSLAVCLSTLDERERDPSPMEREREALLHFCLLTVWPSS